jgi:hypothetical protein
VAAVSAEERPERYMATRVFIPAFYSDNVEMLAVDPHYVERSILPLGGAKARQLAYGDWDSNDGMMFGPDWEAEHIVRESDTALLNARVHAAADPAVARHAEPAAGGRRSRRRSTARSTTATARPGRSTCTRFCRAATSARSSSSTRPACATASRRA